MSTERNDQYEELDEEGVAYSACSYLAIKELELAGATIYVALHTSPPPYVSEANYRKPNEPAD